MKKKYELFTYKHYQIIVADGFVQEYYDSCTGATYFNLAERFTKDQFIDELDRQKRAEEARKQQEITAERRRRYAQPLLGYLQNEKDQRFHITIGDFVDSEEDRCPDIYECSIFDSSNREHVILIDTVELPAEFVHLIKRR